MSASFSHIPTTTTTTNALFPAQRGQLRHTLAGLLSSPWVLYVLFFSPLGVLGAHHAWLGHWKRALAYLITMGLWGGGWLYDLLHFAELAKEQHEQQHKPVTHTTAATSPCTVCAGWAVQVEAKAGKPKDKPDGSKPAPPSRPTAPSAPAASSSLSSWSSPVPPVSAVHSAHHTALVDAFPLPPPPAPSHTHHKRKSDADESERPTSVRVRSAEVDDNVERTRAVERRLPESNVQRRGGGGTATERDGHGLQRDETEAEAERERVAGQQYDEQGSRRQQLKQAMLEQQHTSESASASATVSKPGDGVVYLQTITPSKDSTTAAGVSTAPRVTYTQTAPVGSVPLKPVEPVAVLRPSSDDGTVSTHAASTTAPIPHTASHVPPATPPMAAAEAEDGASGDGGAAAAADEQHRDGGHHNGGRGGYAGNGGGRKRGGRGRRG